MDQLAAMRSFVQVVDAGGFAAAGRSLGLSAPMIGNHIRFLEAELGGLLLNRTTRAQSLTDAGRAYLARCRRVLDELDAAEADVAEVLGSPRGRLRVTAPHNLGSDVLPVIIARFLHDFPSVQVDLRLDNRRLDLLPEGVDAAIRGGELGDTALVTRALAPLELVVCAAPDYLHRRGEPATLADLASHDCLDFAEAATLGVWRFDTAAGPVSIAVSGPLRANSGIALRAAARAGLGVILQPRILVREEIEAGRLIPLLTAYRPQSRPLQLLTLPDRQPAPKLRAFIDALVRELGPGAGPNGFPP